MPETKEEIAAERDALREENDRLIGDINRMQASAAAQQPLSRGYAPAQQFQLSEGDRQELVAHGVVNIGGRMRTRDEVAAMLGDKQRGVDLGDGPVDDVAGDAASRPGIRGFDFVYPSVAPGKIDPAVAGLPGINGPSADADVSRETSHEGVL